MRFVKWQQVSPPFLEIILKFYYKSVHSGAQWKDVINVNSSVGVRVR